MRPFVFLVIPLLLGALLHYFKVPLLATVMSSQIEDYSLRYQQQSPEEFLTKNLESILRDRKLLENVSFFNLGSAGQGDASHVLSPFLMKSDDKTGTLRSELQQQLEGAENWTQLQWSELPQQTDTSWLSSLQGFDHWNFDVSLTQNNPIPSKPWEIPRRDLSPLLEWLKVHYLKGKEKNEVVRVLGDGRHLARLLMTTDTSTGINMALEILKLENQFLDSLSHKNKVGLSWARITTESIEAAHRFFAHMDKYLDERLTNETFLIFFNHSVGKCALVRAALFRHLEIKHHPKNYLFSEGLDRVHQAVQLSQRGCRPGLFRKIWQAEQNPFPKMTLLPERAGFVLGFLKKILRKENLQTFPDLVLAFYYLTWSQNQKEVYELEKNTSH